MTRKKPEPQRKPLAERLEEHWADRPELGGSKSAYIACYAAHQVLGVVWRGANEDADNKEVRDGATLQRLAGIGPRDVIEGMLAAQMVATHEAAMECFRRAHLADQTFEGRQLGLRYGDRLVRSFAALTDALNRHRGKGQQVVRVEHVTVQAGGQAIVGAVTRGGGGDAAGSEDRAHAQAALAHAAEPAMRGPDAQREPVPITGGAGPETLPDARRRPRQRRPGR
jgi:hypothetical protein